MKKILLTLLVFVYCQIGFAQLIISKNILQADPILNPAMVIQVGARDLEVLPSLRALRLNDGKYQLIESESAYSGSLFGVAFDHTQKAYVFLTGDISFRLKNGSSLSVLPNTIAPKSKLIANPDTYVLNVNSPSEVVNLFNQLKASPAVEWAEVFIIQGVVG